MKYKDNIIVGIYQKFSGNFFFSIRCLFEKGVMFMENKKPHLMRWGLIYNLKNL